MDTKHTAEELINKVNHLFNRHAKTEVGFYNIGKDKVKYHYDTDTLDLNTIKGWEAYKAYMAAKLYMLGGQYHNGIAYDERWEHVDKNDLDKGKYPRWLIRKRLVIEPTETTTQTV